MNIVTNRIMSIIATLLTTLLCFTGLQACEKGEVDRQPEANPKITFELPVEWEGLNESEYNNLSGWSAYIPDPPEGIGPGEAKLDEDEQLHYWKFTLTELVENDIPPGETPQEKAQWFYERRLGGCTDRPDCTVEPIRVDQYFGITAYTIEDIDESGEPLYTGEYTTVFFEKDGHMFEFGVRGDIKNPITQKTVEMVMETLKIGN